MKTARLYINGMVITLAFASIANANLLTNPGFESGSLAGWIGSGGNYSTVTSPVHSGSYACHNFNRTATWNSIRRNIDPIMTVGSTYRISIWACVNSDGPYKANLQTKVTASGSGTIYKQLDTKNLTTEWSQLVGEYTYTYDGSLTEAVFYVVNPPVGVDVYYDDASIVLLYPLWSGETTHSITLTSAWVSAKAETDLTEAVLVWDTQDRHPGTTNDWPNTLNLGAQSAGQIAAQMTGLSKNTEYTWRIYGANSVTNGWTAAKTFTCFPSVVGPLESKDSIVGERQSNAPAAGYYPGATLSSPNLSGAQGSSYKDERENRVVVLGFKLPTLPGGTTFTNATLNFEIVKARDHAGIDPSLNVYLLDTENPDSTGTKFFYHGSSDSNSAVAFVGETYISVGTAIETFAADQYDQAYTLTGAARTLLESFYGGDNIPNQSEAFFRFNLDKEWNYESGTPYQQYWLNLADDESSLIIYHTEPPPKDTILIIR